MLKIILIIILVILVFAGSFIGLLYFYREAKKAKAANRAKSNFLSRMSHEIRTPLNAILGMGEMALYSDNMPKVQEYVRGMKQAGQNLLLLINDILDFSKIETGSLQINRGPFFLASMLDDVINVIQIQLIEKPITFMVYVDPHLPARLMGDEMRIRQILFNLLSNAVKYTRQGTIHLSVVAGTRIKETDNLPIVITVTDTGIGIKTEDMPHIFSDFVRLDLNRNKSIQGTGLGLAITRSLCRAMGGDIEVTSEYDKGSVFIATIPQGTIDNEKLAIVNNPRAKIVLLYDHRPEYIQSLTKTMQALGITVVKTETPDDFIKKLSSGGFSFAFVSEPLLEQAHIIIEQECPSTVLVLLSDIGKVPAFENVIVLPMPAYAVPITNVLNGKAVTPDNIKSTGIGFIAPEGRILVVDDIPANLVVAKGLLSPYKIKIDTCSSGFMALKLIKEHYYDIVFMDHMMPDMDGIETVRKIRKWEKKLGSNVYKPNTIIALTANAIFGMREMFLEEGFNDYLSKPIEMFRLNVIMKTWIPKDKQKPRTEKDQEKAGNDMFVNTVVNGIDLEKGSKRYPGNAYLDVLRAWCRQTPALLDILRNRHDMKDYVITVHGIKGSSYGICADAVAKKAEALEAAGRREDIQYIADNNEPFIEEVSVLLQNLEKVLAGLEKDAEEKTAAGTPDTVLLSRLLDACKQYKSSLMEEILGELEKYEYESGGDLVVWLRDQLDNLEYEAIQERLESIVS